MNWHYLLNPDIISVINEYRYQILIASDASVLLEMVIPNALEAFPGESIIRLLDTNCGLTQQLLYYALTGKDIGSNDGSWYKYKGENINDGIYQIAINGYTNKYPTKEFDIEDYENLLNIIDHSFILIVDGNYCTLIHSYSGLYMTQINFHERAEFLNMFSDLLIHYNDLFHTDFHKLDVKYFDITITSINPSGTIKSNLKNIKSKNKWFNYTNEILNTYGYHVGPNGNILHIK